MKPEYSVITKLNLLLSVAWMPTVAFGAPDVHSVSTDPSDRNMMVITGSGFQSADHSFSILNTVQQRLVYETGKDLYNLGDLDFWRQQGSSWASPLVASSTSDGEVVYKGYGKSYNVFIDPQFDEDNDSLYVSWRFKPSDDINKSGGSNKLIRIWDEDSDERTGISWTQMHLTHSAQSLNYQGDVSWGGWGGNVNEWNHLELWIDSSAGTIKAWTNGKLVHDVNDFRKGNPGSGLMVRLIGFDPSVTSAYENLQFSIDDIYTSNSYARVLISPEPTWKAAKNNHLAQVIKSWSPTKIEGYMVVPENYSSELYFYVMGPAGSVNASGYKYCSRCPSEPTVTIEN